MNALGRSSPLVPPIVIGVLVFIALLASLMFLDTQPERRDVVRTQDIHHLKEALAVYQSVRQTFPVSHELVELTGYDEVSAALRHAGAITVVPQDPLYPEYAYWYRSDGNGYTLYFCLETDRVQNYAAGCENTVRP